MSSHSINFSSLGSLNCFLSYIRFVLVSLAKLFAKELRPLILCRHPVHNKKKNNSLSVFFSLSSSIVGLLYLHFFCDSLTSVSSFN